MEHSLPPSLLTPITSVEVLQSHLSFDNLLEGFTKSLKALLLMAMIYYRERNRDQPRGETHRGVWGSTRTSCPLPVESGCISFQASTCDNTYEVLATEEAALCFGVLLVLEFHSIGMIDGLIAHMVDRSLQVDWYVTQKSSPYTALFVFLVWPALTLVHTVRLPGMIQGQQVNTDIPVRHRIPRAKARPCLWARSNSLLFYSTFLRMVLGSQKYVENHWNVQWSLIW